MLSWCPATSRFKAFPAASRWPFCFCQNEMQFYLPERDKHTFLFPYLRLGTHPKCRSRNHIILSDPSTRWECVGDGHSPQASFSQPPHCLSVSSRSPVGSGVGGGTAWVKEQMAAEGWRLSCSHPLPGWSWQVH